MLEAGQVEERDPGQLVARCIVCRGDIHENEPHEQWEGGYYCERHSLPWLRERARQYAELLQQQARDRRH
jgi:hypothetical protein